MTANHVATPEVGTDVYRRPSVLTPGVVTPSMRGPHLDASREGAEGAGTARHAAHAPRPLARPVRVRQSTGDIHDSAEGGHMVTAQRSGASTRRRCDCGGSLAREADYEEGTLTVELVCLSGCARRYHEDGRAVRREVTAEVVAQRAEEVRPRGSHIRRRGELGYASGPAGRIQDRAAEAAAAQAPLPEGPEAPDLAVMNGGWERERALKHAASVAADPQQQREREIARRLLHGIIADREAVSA